MFPPQFGLIATLFVIASVATTQAESPLLADEFDSLDESNWTVSSIGFDAIPPSVSNGQLIANAGATANGHSCARSKQAIFSPFDQSLSIKVDIASLEGAPGPGRNVGYVMIGRTQLANAGGISGTPNYYPGTSSLDDLGTISLGIWQRKAARFSLIINQQVAGVSDSGIGDIAMTEAPSSIEWTLSVNSANLLEWKVVLGGAQFAESGSDSLSGVYTKDVTAAVLQNAYLALGAWNNYNTVASATIFNINSILVTPIPKPGK